MLSKRLISLRKNFGSQLISVANYSRKSDSNDNGYYKIVKSNDVIEDVMDSRFGSCANWELFAPRGYRFLLPGSLGPAWHEVRSMDVDMFRGPTEEIRSTTAAVLQCKAQECPLLLRKGVGELFPGSEACSSPQLTVITLSRKESVKHRCRYDVHEYYTKVFIWCAQDICNRLKDGGYWADFINPFSGKPYISPFHKSTLYETDERFRCLGFEIQQNNNCKVIKSRKDKIILGNLFTNAPVPFIMENVCEVN